MPNECVYRDESEAEFPDQYIAVLLEYYLVRHETRGHGPLGRAKLRYWEGIVRAFEKVFPAKVRPRIRYRLRKGEKMGLGPVQLAAVRYAWTVFLSGWEAPDETRRRWNRYVGSQEETGRVISFEAFDARRRFRNMMDQLEEAGLWPPVSGAV